MSNLPNPKDFGSFKAELLKTVKFDEVATNYNLEEIYNSMINNSIPIGLIEDIFKITSLNMEEIIKKYLVYSKIDNSLAIILKDKEEIKTIAINRSFDKDKNLIKWKTLGSKKYIQYKIKDDFLVFVGFGMKEILLFEMMEVSYIAFQSDSIVYGLNNHTQWIEDIKPMIQDKYLILLLDNDESCRNTIYPLKNEHKFVIDIEMIDLLQEKAFLTDITNIVSNESKKIWREKKLISLNKGFDFVDFVNETKNLNILNEILKRVIKVKL